MAGEALKQLEGGRPVVGVSLHTALDNPSNLCGAILRTPARGRMQVSMSHTESYSDSRCLVIATAWWLDNGVWSHLQRFAEMLSAIGSLYQ